MQRMAARTATKDFLLYSCCSSLNAVIPNFAFQFIEGESLLIKLDMAGICGSSGSACTSGSLDPSHVLLAIGLPHEIAHGSLRLTLSEENTMEEMDYVVDQIKEIVSYLRGMSPLYEDYMRRTKEK